MSINKVDVNITAGQDDESLPIECLCGHGKNPWTFSVSIYDTDPTECPECGRQYFLRNLGVEVYLVEN